VFTTSGTYPRLFVTQIFHNGQCTQQTDWTPISYISSTFVISWNKIDNSLNNNHSLTFRELTYTCLDMARELTFANTMVS
jgi:hypothetical protein